MATVSDLIKKKSSEVFTVPANASIRDTLLVMAKEDVGALPVLEGDHLAGIFSERDFARLLAKSGAFPLDTPVGDVMTKKVFTVELSTKIETCMEMMTEKHIRHLPVMEKEKLIGLISIGDVVKTIISSQREFIDQLEGYISGNW